MGLTIYYTITASADKATEARRITSPIFFRASLKHIEAEGPMAHAASIQQSTSAISGALMLTPLIHL